MANLDPEFPSAASALVGEGNRPTTWYYKWFQKLQRRLVESESTAQAASDAVANIDLTRDVYEGVAPIRVEGDDHSYRISLDQSRLNIASVPGPPGMDGVEADQWPAPPGERGPKGEEGKPGGNVWMGEDPGNVDPFPLFAPSTATAASSGQSAIQFKDEGSNVGSSGAITSFDVVGTGGSLAVVGTAATLTLSGGGSSSNYQPGSADKPPTSANAKDDEFDGTSSVSWTSTPTAPTSWNINSTRESHAYLKANSGSTLVGKYQAVPSFPFTITIKVSSTGRGNFHRSGGIILLPASPTSSTPAIYYGGTVDTTQKFYRITYSSMSANTGVSASPAGVAIFGPWYFQVTCNSATNITTRYSTDGYNWIASETSLAIGFTIANMGVAASDEGVGGAVEAYFDFFRVT